MTLALLLRVGLAKLRSGISTQRLGIAAISASNVGRLPPKSPSGPDPKLNCRQHERTEDVGVRRAEHHVGQSVAPEFGELLADAVLTLNELAVSQTHVLVDLQPLAVANGCE